MMQSRSSLYFKSAYSVGCNQDTAVLANTINIAKSVVLILRRHGLLQTLLYIKAKTGTELLIKILLKADIQYYVEVKIWEKSYENILELTKNYQINSLNKYITLTYQFSLCFESIIIALEAIKYDKESS